MKMKQENLFHLCLSYINEVFLLVGDILGMREN